jgi:hypothetical protein
LLSGTKIGGQQEWICNKSGYAETCRNTDKPGVAWAVVVVKEARFQWIREIFISLVPPGGDNLIDQIIE